MGILASGATSTIQGTATEGVTFDADGPGFTLGPPADAFTFTLEAEATILAGNNPRLFPFSNVLNLSLTGPVSGIASVPIGPRANVFGALAPGDYLLQIGASGPRFNAPPELAYLVDFNVAEAAVVPLPASALLLLTGLASLGVFRMRKRA